MSNRPQTTNFKQNHEKKKFDKKKFWDKKLNLKNRVQEWGDKRQKYVMRKYQKELRKGHINTQRMQTNKSAPMGEDPPAEGPPSREQPQRLSSLKKAQLELERRKEEAWEAKEAKLRKQKEMEEALEKYKKKKAEKFKKLSKKTKRGQPVMKDRLELLLEEIKQKIANES